MCLLLMFFDITHHLQYLLNIYMKSRLADSPCLKGALANVMSKAFDLGYIPSINNTKSEKLCLIISNEDSGKCALLGTMINDSGIPTAVACLVNISDWQWAESEGFNWNQIMSNNTLYNKIFRKVPVDFLPDLLA